MKDASGEPIMGATITVNGKAVGITDMDGNFSVDAAPGAKITFTYLGMTPQTVKASSNMNITLEDDSKALNEVVVIGYGVAKKNRLDRFRYSYQARREEPWYHYFCTGYDPG